MNAANFGENALSFSALMEDLGLTPLVPSERPVLYLLPEPRPLMAQEGALVLFRPEGSLYRYRTASGFLLPEPDLELQAFAEREGMGLALYPPWLIPFYANAFVLGHQWNRVCRLMVSGSWARTRHRSATTSIISSRS